MKLLLILLLILSNSMLLAQLNDDFTDGDFTANPIWAGSNGGTDFIVVDNKVRSNSNTVNTSFYLSTENSLAFGVQWDFWVNFQFSTSGSNYTDVYVMSDKADLKSTLINGYFIRIGNTDDEISLYKRSGTAVSNIKLIDGVNGSVGSSNNTIKIRLKRDNIGKFTLEREIVNNGSSYFMEGTAIDNTHTTTSYFGMLVQQSTASFFHKHYFDNISIVATVTDTVPPALTSLSPIDSNTVEITFSEPMDSVSVKTAANYLINTFSGAVLEILTTPDPAKYRLKMGNSFNDGTYTITVLNASDRNGNRISSSNSSSFTYIRPYSPKPGDVVINEIFADPIPQIDLPSVEFAELRNNTDRVLSLHNWKLTDLGSSATLGEISIDPGSLLILCAKADTAEYKSLGKVLGVSPWPSLNNSGDLIKLISPQNLIIDSIAYSDSWYRNSTKKQGGWTLERRDPASRCDALFNWFASLDTTGGTPGKENSILKAQYDRMALYADSLKQLSDTSIKIYFNKHLNGAFLSPGNFILYPQTSFVEEITADADLKEIIIVYDQRLKPGLEYQVIISNLTDCSGNVIHDLYNKLNFKAIKPVVIEERVDTAKLVITEIFADPSPEIQLPLAEFIEIYNPTKDTVDLDKWTINDPGAKSTIHGQKILPGEYIIFCPLADTVHYKSYGKTIGLSPWPSLNNSSDQISLRSFKGRLVDSVAYFDTWYHNTSKKPGGWSIEKIDLNSACEDFFNWSASIDSAGGTPGERNSVYVLDYDILPLNADSIRVVSDTTIKIYFNKHIDGATLVADNFNLIPANNSAKRIFSDAESKEVTIIYDGKFKVSTGYELHISKIKDCSGNFLVGSVSLKFKTADPWPPVVQKTDTAKIVITEIFADPSPEIGLPLVEFIELYNPGLDTVDLDKWILSDMGTNSFITDVIIAPRDYLILCPASDTLLFKQLGKTKGITPWPSLGNGNDEISLKSFTHRLVDSIAYSINWYKNKNKQNGGWSLEKIDIINSSCNGFYNWAASADLSGGTPGRSNSVHRSQMLQQISIDSVTRTSDSTITLHLNAIPDTFYLKPEYFHINNGIGIAKAISTHENHSKITLKFDLKFQEGFNYIITADSIFTCGGIKSDVPNNQATFTVPTLPELAYPILITEIFADPNPSIELPEGEFIELYNPTQQPVSLKDMSYGDGVLEYRFTTGEISAGSYLIICPEKDTLNFIQYGKVIGLPVWPALANDKDILFLKNNKGRTIHQVAYNAAWYKDNNKKSGGYTLEIIDPQSLCIGSQNWQASRDSTGGTPGRQNSVYNTSSSEPLKLIEVLQTDSVTLLLTFNSTIDSLSASSSTSYNINNGLGHPISVLPLSPNLDQVQIKLKEPPARGHTYRIDVSDIRDCRGNLINPDFSHRDLVLAVEIVKNSVLINEVLFNPRPDGVDFVELYNNTGHLLDLKDLSIATIINDSVSSVKPVVEQQLLLEPGKYIVLTSSPDIIKREYFVEDPTSILKTSIPALNDNSGTVVLLNNQVLIDQFNYTEKMHFQLLKTLEGVSLERSSFSMNANEPGNFRSATAASGFATPGYKNSQYSPDLAGNEEFTLVSRTFSPDNDGFEDLLQVNYRMPHPGMIANVKIYDDKGLLIRNLVKNYTLNMQGAFTWDGLNQFNTLASTGIYIIYVEAFDAKGNLKRFRRSFALATKL